MHVKALLASLMYMILGLYRNTMDVVYVVQLYLVIISDPTDEFLPGDNKDLWNWIELNWTELNFNGW